MRDYKLYLRDIRVLLYGHYPREEQPPLRLRTFHARQPSRAAKANQTNQPRAVIQSPR